MTELPASADRRDDRRRSARSAPAVAGMQGFHLLVSLVPAAIIALAGAAVVAYSLAGHPAPAATRVVVATGAAVAALALAGAACGAEAATRRVRRQLGVLRSVNAQGLQDLQRLAERVRLGERPAIDAPEPGHALNGDPFAVVAHDLQRGYYAAMQVVLKVASLPPRGKADWRVEVFVNLARRMQSLLHREIGILDGLEAEAEDPDLLKGLFAVDHFATRMRRQTESLAVLGGAVSRRQWSRPVPVHGVLRAAIAETEHYSRVKIVPPVTGSLQPGGIADVIHLIAELIDNANKFSPPNTRALLRAEEVTAGLAIEVEDRGLGMTPDERTKMNSLLADHGQVDMGRLLADGRIGLFVVSALARRNGIKVQLQANIYGGTQAVVVLPRGLLAGGELPVTEPSQQTAGQPPSASAAPAGITPGGPAEPGERPALPRRSAPAPAAPLGAPTAHGPEAEPALQHEPARAGRPPLPQRGPQSHMAPQLRSGPTARQDEPTGHTPGLMAAFRGGVRRAEDEGDGRDGDDEGADTLEGGTDRP